MNEDSPVENGCETEKEDEQNLVPYMGEIDAPEIETKPGWILKLWTILCIIKIIINCRLIYINYLFIEIHFFFMIIDSNVKVSKKDLKKMKKRVGIQNVNLFILCKST